MTNPVESDQGYEEGLTRRTLLGGLFISLFMIPGGLYLGLLAGMGVDEAAQWVTIVLFAELARRSYNPLKKQEIYVLYYIASSLTSVVNSERGLAGGPFSMLVWNAYFAASPPAKPFASNIPRWAVPLETSPAMMQRELWHHDWWIPIGLIVLVELCSRLTWLGLGYILFRTTSDVEKLPFPYAPVAAAGATALAEAGQDGWRWKVFSTGSVIGLLFGALYIGLPVLTGTLFGESFSILPIPFADFTHLTESILPGAVVALSVSLGNVIFGMVLPYEIVLGAAVSSVVSGIVLNPILLRTGMLPHYQLGSNAYITKLTADLDFWLSVGIGVNLSVACIGLAFVLKALWAARQARSMRSFTLAPPPGRGDMPMWLAFALWFAGSLTLIVVTHRLVPGFPVWILVFFGLVWTPLNSYVTARMMGLTGRGVSFPYLKEASVVTSGYRGVDVWYAPMPLADHGAAAQRFREVTLTGTKLSSIFKAELLMFPLLLGASFLFWAVFWKQNVVPSGQFPYANRFWPFQAQTQAVMMQINSGGSGNWFKEALKPMLIGGGMVGGLAMFALCSLLKLPGLFFYGLAGGIGAFPAITVPQLFGAWIGKRWLAPRFGAETWQAYAPVLFAGFACGTGLVSMGSIALALVAKSVAQLPY